MADVETTPEFEALLEYLKASRGSDFTGYKRASLRRRIDKRMRELKIHDYVSYMNHLELHPDEFDELFNAILINVTSFFRDAPTWEYLQHEVLPARLAELPPDRPLRIWSAGCASGEEAYTLAMVFAESLGIEEFKRRVKIYGTDIDEEALQAARAATYTEADMETVPSELRNRYFDQSDNRYSFKTDLRRSVIFGRLDVLNDAPISRLELLSCRNTLMYFNAETQARAVERFHFALTDGGVLLLGKAESILAHTNLFAPIDRPHRLFTRVATPGGRAAGFERFANATEPNERRVIELQDVALQAVPFPTLVIDTKGVLVDANEAARQSFGIGPHDYGHLFHDLEVSYRPMELRGPISQAYNERRSVHLNGLQLDLTSTDSPASVDVDVVPLYRGTAALGVAIFFRDVTLQRELEGQLRQTTDELEQAYQEVQSTNEELETTNEELQSTIEELETTNEELQSTNEELETMNEELQSTNDELHTVNEELRLRSDEIDDLNQFLQTILTSFGGGVIVIDKDRRVQVWNPRSEELWGVREEEVLGVALERIDFGLPVGELAPALKAVLDSADHVDDVTVDAVTRRGHPIRCRISFTPLRSSARLSGAILVMEVVGDADHSEN